MTIENLPNTIKMLQNFRFNLVKLRMAKNYTQVQLAEKLDKNRQAIYDWETGKCLPNGENLLKICLVFMVSLEDLLATEIDTKKLEALWSADLKELAA